MNPKKENLKEKETDMSALSLVIDGRKSKGMVVVGEVNSLLRISNYKPTLKMVWGWDSFYKQKSQIELKRLQPRELKVSKNFCIEAPRNNYLQRERECTTTR